MTLTFLAALALGSAAVVAAEASAGRFCPASASTTLIFLVLVLKWPGDSQRESGRFARIDSHESIQKKNYFRNLQAIRANRLKSPIRNFWPPKRDSQKRGSVREPWNDSRQSGDSRESANRFARIGPSKSWSFRKPEDPFHTFFRKLRCSSFVREKCPP